MTRVRTPFLVTLGCVALYAALSSSVSSLGAESASAIRFARIPHIDNDGRIAFSYHGDIWTADGDGSRAQRLTSHIASDFAPRFSPDGAWIAFTSNRTGNNDVFLIPRAGGEPRQLTFYSGEDQVLYWMPDGKSILIWSNRGPFAFGSPLYRLPIDGAAEEPLKMSYARLGMVRQDGTQLAFNRTLPSSGVWRKAFRGNSAPGLAVQDLKTGHIVEITNADMKAYRDHYQDIYPMWGADGMIYFASERDGTYNIWRIAPRGGAPQQVTRFKEGGVFYPAVSPNGRRLIFQHEFDLWTLDLPGGAPKKVSVPLSFDPKDNDVTLATVNGVATGFSPSPDGESVAVEIRSDIQLVPAQQGVGEQTPIARTAWKETGQKFSPDGKRIAYISDESGDQEIWMFELATGARTRLTTQSSEKRDILWSSNSQKFLYADDSRLWELDMSASQPQPVELTSNQAGGFANVQYAANGTWLVYSRRDEDQNADVYLYDIREKKEYNVTKSPSLDAAGLLTPDGKSVVFVSSRNGPTQLFAVSLTRLTEDRNDPLVRERLRNQPPAAGRGGRAGNAGPPSGDPPAAPAPAAGAPAAQAPQVADGAPARMDLDGIDKRAIALTGTNESVAAGFFLSPDGRTVYFAAAGAGGRGIPAGVPPELLALLPAQAGAAGAADGLFAIGIDGRDRRTVATGTFPGMVPTPDRRALFFFRAAPAADAGGATGPAVTGRAVHRLLLQGGRQERVNFTVSLRIDRRAEWKQMFSEVWRVLKHRYYNPEMNGRDWDGVKDKYEPMLAHVGTNEDFYNLGNAMVGELSSSHLGVSGPPTHTIAPVYATRFLGFDLELTGGAYRISHIYRDGPADKEWLGLAVGDVVLAIDSQPLAATSNYWKILSSTTNEYIPVRVAKTTSGEEARTVRIASVTNLADIKYEEFVARNREIVDKGTGGQMAYVHIRTMDQPSLTRFRTEIDRYWNKKGIIVDVRFNNGGNIDVELLDILERRPYMFTNPRNGARTWGRRPQQAIAGPKVMLINERSYSDAEATPMGFRTLGLGRLVGAPTAGGVIWTNNIPLINGGTVRVPGQLAVVFDAARPNNYGTNLENFGVPPDVWVENSLNDEIQGIDRQLQAAIDEVMRMAKAGAAP